jgi:signal transduction histidine kinase/ActR/RegA family two-component response regulator
MWQTLTSGKTWNGQFINKKKDGNLFNEDATISPVRDAFGKTVNYVAVKRDITAEIKMEEALRQAQKMEAVGIMAGGIAHDFNNNLAIILGNVELSLLSSPANSKIITRLENAKTAALRARDLVNQILIYSRQGTQVLKPVQIDLVIDETLRLLRSTIPTTVKIKKTITGHCQDIIIYADSTQLQEVLINFCNNAVHAMDDQGEIEISLNAVDVKSADIPPYYQRPPGQYAKLRVQDTGSGMSPDTIKRIFDPFYTTKAVGKGTGMGLAVVHGIIETHGGFVVVNSALGKGSIFDVFFPMFEAIKVEEVKINTNLPKGTEHILFLDDEEMLAQLGSTILSEQGYRVTTETSSTRALKVFKENPEQFDLVITDQTMPELCGRDLIKELLTIKPSLPTILCTGYSKKINKAEARQLGIKAFCLKPLDLQQLVQTVRRVLDKQQR